MTPQERADKVRHAFEMTAQGGWHGMSYGDLANLLPPGSIILTPDEAENVRDEFASLVSIGGDGQLHDPDCVGRYGYDCRERLCGGLRKAFALLGGVS